MGEAAGSRGGTRRVGFFPFLWREPRAFRGGETQCNCALKKKKKEAAGRFGGRFGNLKLTPKVFFFFFKLFFFFWKAVKCRERISGRISPPQPAAFAGFLEKVNCLFPLSCGGDCGRLGMGVSGTRKCLLEEALQGAVFSNLEERVGSRRSEWAPGFQLRPLA